MLTQILIESVIGMAFGIMAAHWVASAKRGE
jgi:hypothetical protein